MLTLVLFMIPTFVEHRLHIDVPNTLEIIILLFIFSAEILGEIQEYYLLFSFWDTMLHTINGFLMAAIGIAMVDILNRSRKFKVRLSPAFVALVAFCFSMTVGVVWEFFEYGMDVFFHTDMPVSYTHLKPRQPRGVHPPGRENPRAHAELEKLKRAQPKRALSRRSFLFPWGPAQFPVDFSKNVI